jgi:glutamate-1-semialdehyde 2,1-aminomutase
MATALLGAADIQMTGTAIGGLFGFHLSNTNGSGDYTEIFNKFFHYMLANGVYFAPSRFEAGFMSTCHTEADLLKVAKIAAGFKL